MTGGIVMVKYFIHPESKDWLPIQDCLDKGLLNEYYPLSYLRLCADIRHWTGKASTTQCLNGTRLQDLLHPLRQGWRNRRDLLIFCHGLKE